MNVKLRMDPFRLVAPRSSLLCSNEGGGDGTGGGGEGGDGKGGDGNGGDGNGQPQGLDAETKKFIANTINSSVASFMKRDSFKQSIAESVSGVVGNAVAEALKQNQQQPNPEPEPGKGKGDKPDPRDAEIAKMKSEQEKLRRKMEESEQAAQAEKTKARTQAERSKLTDALRKGGVDDSRIGAAVAYLYLDQKRIKRDPDTDKIVMSFEREWGEELLPLDKGIPEYLKSDEGKAFLPPLQAGGSGNKGGRPPTRKPGEKATRGELMGHLGNLMLHGGALPGKR